MLTRKILANSVRMLSIDAVQKANSGHPGMPMGMADIAEVLWNDFLRHNPNNPKWVNRDRFVISNGHGSMLLYSLLHFTGYDLSIEDIKNFRQFNSKTPGHPEYGFTPGVETTTGPLGQGFANACGMAIAEKHLSSIFNQPEFLIVDHFTYVFVGDGCLMEGISHETASLAGTLKLGKLITFYDDNNISIDGSTDLTFNDDTPKRFEAYGWHVISNVNGHDPDEVKEAIKKAQSITDKPSIICCKTTIGFGSPALAGSEKTHGSPLGEDEINATRKNLNWDYGPFDIPQKIYEAWNAKEKGESLEKEWQDLFSGYKQQYPELAKEFQRRIDGKFPDNWEQIKSSIIKSLSQYKDPLASRKASKLCLDELTKHLPELFGGSADLTGSNLTKADNVETFSPLSPNGTYLHYGVREFAMCAIMNGLYLHGGLIPFGGTFLVFLDYARNAVRLSALMKTKVIYVFTHDSIGLGEDGPTHQPIEHINMLRQTPNMSVWRPCDMEETAIAWLQAIEHSGPTALILSRQNLPLQKKSNIDDISLGGYVLKETPDPEAIIMATGSEVALASDVFDSMVKQGYKLRLVSMPSLDYFEKQSDSCKETILPKNITKRLAIEAGTIDAWYPYVGEKGKVIGINKFGASAPANILFKEYHLNKEYVEQILKTILNS